MNGLMFQSIQMVNKQTLKIDQNEVYNPDIVKILPSSSSYVDNAYFSIYANEDRMNPAFKNFPVEIKGIIIDWIIDFENPESNGKKFL